MRQIKFILNFILSRNFNLVNSPFQFMCFIEYLKKNKDDFKDTNIVYVGYCSRASKEQIKNINLNIYQTNLKIFFLDEIFNIKIFHAIFFILKNIKRNFLISICGTYKYYLFKEFVKKSNEIVFLDEGFDLIYHQNQKDIKKYNTKVFTCFDIKDKNLKKIQNDFDHLKRFKNKNSIIDKNLIFCLGTSFFESEHRLGEINQYLSDICERYKDQEIWYFPHIGENINRDLYKNLNFKIIDVPFEIYALQCKRLPTTICGFYSTALYTLKKIIDKRINIININFDLNNHRWDDSPDVDKHIHFNKILNENGVINFY